MTTAVDLVRQVLTTDPQTRVQLAEATGLEAAVVSVALSHLRRHGHADRSEEGWVASGASAQPSGHRVVPSVTLAALASSVEETAAPPRKRRGRPPKADGPKPGKRRARGTAVAVVAPATPVAERRAEFAITESGGIMVKVLAGAKQGEIGEIAPADAAALFALMQRVLVPAG